MIAAQQIERDRPARDELQPGAVGRLLRETREGYRQDIATVSQQLRIRSVYLKAIEDGNYQDLPGSTYAVGFVRSYAEYLGLNPQEIVRRFRDEDAEVNRRTKLVFPVPSAEAKVPSGALVLIALALAVIAYGGWYYLSDRDRSLVDLVPSVPESLKDLIESDAPTETASSDDAPTPSAATAAETDPATASASAATTVTTVITPGADTETDAPAADTAAATAPATATTDAAVVEPGAATTILDGATAAPEPGADLNPEPDSGASGIDATATADVDPASTAEAESAAAGDAATDLAPVETAAPDGEAAVETPQPTAETATDSASEAAASAVTAASQPAEEQLVAIPEAPRVPDSVQDGQSFGVAFGGSRVVIVARMESFLRVRDEVGNEIWSRLLRSGDRYLVPERAGLTLSVGNAGGIDIFVDGTKAPALGAVGVGVTGISLDPERLRSGTALP